MQRSGTFVPLSPVLSEPGEGTGGQPPTESRTSSLRFMKESRYLLALMVVMASGGSVVMAEREAGRNPRQVLTNGWSVRSSAQVPEKPEVVSTTRFSAKGW